MESTAGSGHQRDTPEKLLSRLGSLTFRQREILELVQLGLTNAEIAQHLVISAGTVRKHVENAYSRLGIHSRTQAAALLSAARVLPPMPPDDDAEPELPRYLTSFVGRERQIEQLLELLPSCRLLTLTGAGGVGKTRLAVELGARASAGYRDGVRFIDFGRQTDPSLVPQVVAAQLGIREQPGYGVLETLVHFLRSKRVLLVLDNCEHLLAASATLADALLHRCAELQIVATSRQSLRIDGETIYPVPPLAVPEGDDVPHDERLMDWEAVRLVVERARTAAPSFRLATANAGHIVEICRQLDGIPLALELAAALVRTRPLDTIARGLTDRFGILVAGSRTAVPRQQTLRATVDWSHDLLSDAERVLFRRIAVFAGGFDAEAAEAVCAGDYGSESVLDLLASLVDKSLVVLTADAGGRYRLLDMVRDYARQRLAEAGEENELLARHRDWYLAVAEGAARDLYGGPQQAATVERLEREHDNFRAALEWSRATANPDPAPRDPWLRMARSLWRFWEIRGYLTEARRWLEPALARTRGEVSELRANALTGAGILAFMQGDHAASWALHEESLALHRELGNRHSVALALSNLGNLAIELGDLQRASACHEEAAQIHEALGNVPEEAGAALHLADVADRMGDETGAHAIFERALGRLEAQSQGFSVAGDRAFPTWMLSYGYSMYAASVLGHGHLEQARKLALRSLFLYREIGDMREGTRLLALLAEIANRQGDPASAASLLVEALSTRLAMGDRPGTAAMLERIADLAAHTNPERAVRLLGTAEALREQMGAPLPVRERERHDALTRILASAVGPERYMNVFDAGRLLSMANAVDEAAALAQVDASAPPSPR